MLELTFLAVRVIKARFLLPIRFLFSTGIFVESYSAWKKCETCQQGSTQLFENCLRPITLYPRKRISIADTTYN